MQGYISELATLKDELVYMERRRQILSGVGLQFCNDQIRAIKRDIARVSEKIEAIESNTANAKERES